MVKIGEYGPVIECVANEGNVTIQSGNALGGDIDIPVVASPINKGQPVKIVGYDDEEQAPIVQLCSAGDKAAGYAYNTPYWEVEPTAAATYGNYKSRRLSVEFRCKCIETVQIEAANSKIVVGDSIEEGSTTVGAFDKASGTTCDKALQAVAANKGGVIDVMFGVY